MTEDELASEIGKLSPKRRAGLFEKLGVSELGNPPTFIVMIHDWESTDREKPRAAIVPFEGPDEFTYIDIIKSIENNALSVAHPAILLAIRRWEQVIRYQKGFSLRSRKRHKPVVGNLGDFYWIAKNHLENVGKALVSGATERAIPLPDVFNGYVKGVYSRRDDYLNMAWQLLTDKSIKKINNADVRLNEIKRRMIEWALLPGSSAGPLPKKIVQQRKDRVEFTLRFIKEVGFHRNKRTRGLEGVRNAFNAWLFGIEEDVAKKYKSQARVWHAEIEECFLLPDFQNEGTFFYNQYNCFFAGSLPNWGEIPVQFISDQPIQLPEINILR